MDNKLFTVATVVILALGVVGALYKGTLMNKCIESGNPNSKECFKYNVFNDTVRNVNITGEIK
jgi:hypothetical protein